MYHGCSRKFVYLFLHWKSKLLTTKNYRMNILNLKIVLVAFMCSASVYLTSCKGKPKETQATEAPTTTTPEQTAPAPAPVEISNDNALITGVRDATKDYPGVKADVNNGEITLTGEIQRSRLPNLMQSLNTLKPKKINNQLTIK